MHHADITRAHAAVIADIEDAALGWTGSSGGALKALILELQARASHTHNMVPELFRIRLRHDLNPPTENPTILRHQKSIRLSAAPI